MVLLYFYKFRQTLKLGNSYCRLQVGHAIIVTDDHVMISMVAASALHAVIFINFHSFINIFIVSETHAAFAGNNVFISKKRKTTYRSEISKIFFVITATHAFSAI